MSRIEMFLAISTIPFSFSSFVPFDSLLLLPDYVASTTCSVKSCCCTDHVRLVAGRRSLSSGHDSLPI